MKIKSLAAAFQEQRFRNKVDDALQVVKRILELHRNPQLAGEVDHAYGDKYSLVDQMTNMAVIGQVNALARLGLTANIIESIDQSQSVTMRFQASESCIFLKEQTVEVPDSKSFETDEIYESATGSSALETIKQVIHHVKEYHWRVNIHWTISVYFGTKDEDEMILSSRSSSKILVTQSHNGAPLPENSESRPLDVSLNWLMKNIDTKDKASIFHVDTQSPKTKTPRRNPQVEDALSFMRDLSSWMKEVLAFNMYVEQHIVDKHNPVSSVPRPNPEERLSRHCDDTFVPVQPLFDEGDKGSTHIDVDSNPTSESILSLPPQHGDDAGAHGSSVLLSTDDMYKFLNEQVRTLKARLDVLDRTYPASSQPDKFFSVAEASMVLISLHCESIVSSYIEGVGYTEKMLEDQLVSAIGKRLKVSDIDQFLRHHNARLLHPPPQPFCHAIRQPEHYPCGILSIEGVQNDGKRNPIETLVREVDYVSSIKLTLNAATSVELTGKVFLHGWIHHSFGGAHLLPVLIARARQFSSFLLVVGTMSGSDQMDPKDAIILQNKDELIIPLILDEIPTAKEFKDAIRSMSPEQQRFAQAFRKMQLGSSVLGISVIQIKPQLEALLGLPCGSLTKEMKLTQDLMELFVDYQVPSDLLSYDCNDSSAGRKERVDNVRSHVEAVSGVIDKAKAKELKEQSMKADMALLRSVESLMGQDAEGQKVLPNNARSADNVPTFANNCLMDLMKGRRMEKYSNVESAGPGDSMGQGQPTTQMATCLENHAPPVTATPDGAMDFAAVPRILDSAIEKYAQGAAVRSTTIALSDRWIRNRHVNLLAKAPTKSYLRPDDLKQEQNKAMDLLDALSRNGSLPISFSELHVIVCVTHCFEKDLIETIIQDNINPIEKLENTTLLVGSAIYGVPASGLIGNREDLQRLKLSFPLLLDEQKDAST